ncbi:MAG: HPr kinase/phosphatase C-terminal domain-containing protein, partial [Novosphingobium sp.]
MQPYQATCVVIDGRGVLIEGEPGTGKSSLALALMDRGAKLVGDDSLLIEARDGKLWAHPHPSTEGLLEVRNLGLLPQPVLQETAVTLVLRLDDTAPRFIDAAEIRTILGVPLPQVLLWPDSPVL